MEGSHEVEALLGSPDEMNVLFCFAVDSYSRKEGNLMECQQSKNLEKCNCSYGGCAKKGLCCQCLSYHLKSRQLPACCFPADVERTYDRS